MILAFTHKISVLWTTHSPGKTVPALIVTMAMMLTACHTPAPGDPLEPSDASTRYASLLQMQDVDASMTVCRIMNPWQPERIAIQYLLTKGETDAETLERMEHRFGRMQVLRVPLQRQTISASCHAWLLNELEALSSIRVMCDANYVRVREMTRMLDDGTVADGGNSMSPNAEVIRAAGSDAIWISPYEGASQQIMSTLLPDIPIIYCADYMETGPLARAEWMRFYGRLVDKAAKADSLFSAVEKHYEELTGMHDTEKNAGSNTSGKKLLADLPYGSTWYVAGGRSTLGTMYKDAGFCYPWADDVHGGSLALAPEAVFEKAHDADIWLFKYNSADNDMTLTELTAQNPLFVQIKAVMDKNVYGCNTSNNDYFDVTPFRPDLLMEELNRLASGKTDSLRYFERLVE